MYEGNLDSAGRGLGARDDRETVTQAYKVGASRQSEYKDDAGLAYVFLNNFSYTAGDRIPIEDFDVLLDGAGLGRREAHERLEKSALFFLNGPGTERFEVASDATLLIGSELRLDEVFDKSDHVHGGVACVASFLTVDARNDDKPIVVLLLPYGVEGDV